MPPTTTGSRPFTIFHAALLQAAILLPATAAAQIQSRLETGTPLGVYAVQANDSQYKTTASGLAIQKTVGLTVNAMVSNAFWSAMVGFYQWPGDIVTVDLSGQGGFSGVGTGTAPAFAGTSPSPGPSHVPGPHSVLLTLNGPPGSRGLVETWATGGLSNSGTISGSHALDIGDDNRFEFQGPVVGFTRGSFAVQFPANGTLRFRLQSDVAAAQTTPGGFLCKTGMSFRFTPAPLCIGAPYGSSCGPELSGKATASGADYLFDIAVTMSTANAPGLLVAGMDAIEVPIPGIQCPLLTTPLVVLQYATDPAGQRTLQFRFPRSTLLDLRVQVADLGGGGARASNGLHIACLQ